MPWRLRNCWNKRRIEPVFKETLEAKENEIRISEKDRLKRTKDLYFVFDRDALDGQRATIGWACQELREELSRETASKLADKDRELMRMGSKTWRTRRGSKRSEGPWWRPVERKS